MAYRGQVGARRGAVGFVLIVSALLWVAACGSGTQQGSCSSGPSPSGVMCPTEPGCNSVNDTSLPVNATCLSGTMPTGTGGTIADGTYVLTSQTFYNAGSVCPGPLAQTLVVTGSCAQVATVAYPNGASTNIQGTVSLTTQGSAITLFPQCTASASGDFTPELQQGTYTATATSVTFYIRGCSGKPDEVDVVTKQ